MNIRTNEEHTRLPVNLTLDTAAALKREAAIANITITEAVRNAIALMKYINDQRRDGNKIAIVVRTNGRERIYELLFTDYDRVIPHCICGADSTGEDIDERPDCPAHEWDESFDTGEDPY
jgi:hypothetical protein